MKKLIALVLAALMLAGVLVACGGGDTKTDDTSSKPADSGKTPTPGSDDPFYGEDNISLLVWAPSNAVALTDELCKEFIAQYPDKHIEITVKPMEEGDAGSQILNDPSVAADVFSFACDQLTDLNKAKVLSALNDYLDDVKARDSAASVNAATMGGEVLAYPETGENGYYLVYDKSVVSDEDAKTFEGVLAACRKAGVKFNMDAKNGFFACIFMFTGGVELTGIEDDVQQFNDYDTEKVVDVLEAFNKLLVEYKDVFQSDNVDKTGSGVSQNPRVIGAGIDGSWNAKKVAEYLGDDYGAVKLPTIDVKGTATQIISMNGYKLIGVNDYSKFPEAAHVLANYLAGEHGQQVRAEQLAWSPSNKVVAASDVVASNLGTVACLAQAEFSRPQVNIAKTFWDNVGALGGSLFEEGLKTRAELTKIFEETIINIKDE